MNSYLQHMRGERVFGLFEVFMKKFAHDLCHSWLIF